MEFTDRRATYLGWVEIALQVENPDLSSLCLAGQSHYGPQHELAFVGIYGVDHDDERRRSIRSRASDLLACLGCRVRLDPSRDVYHVRPHRPMSAHARLHALGSLHAALAAGSGDCSRGNLDGAGSTV